MKLGREHAQECLKEREALKFCPTRLQHGLLPSTYWGRYYRGVNDGMRWLWDLWLPQAMAIFTEISCAGNPRFPVCIIHTSHGGWD